jgi:preprotein translocase subunit SecF
MFDIPQIFGKLTNLIMLIIVAFVFYFAYTMVMKFMGPDKSQVTLGRQEVVIDNVKANNAQLKDALVTQGKANDITQNAVQENSQAQQDNRSAKDINYQKTEKKVTDLKKDYNTKISQTTDPVASFKLIQEKEAQISQVRISALWFNYCKAEPQDVDCKEEI